MKFLNTMRFRVGKLNEGEGKGQSTARVVRLFDQNAICELSGPKYLLA